MIGLKVLHAPNNVGNQSWSLCQMEREISKIGKLNYVNHNVNFYPSNFLYQSDEIFNYRPTIAGLFLRRISMAYYFFKSLRKYDIFHFYFGKTFFPPPSNKLDYLDLKILKAFNKKIFMTFQGCDARLREVAKRKTISSCSDGECSNSWCNGNLDRLKKKSINIITKYCSHVFCLNPDLIPNVPGAEFIPYCVYNNNNINCRKNTKPNNKRLIIAHAPTDRNIKGTKYILKAFERIKKSYPVDCLIIENIPHSKAMDMFRQVDIVVDQLLIGWYGGLAVEVMQMGKPVIAYINNEDLNYIPREMREELPIINATPDNITDVLINVLKNKEMIHHKGESSKTYVENWHNGFNIAKSMIELYDDPSKSFWNVYLKNKREFFINHHSII